MPSFELLDAATVAGLVPSLAYVSLTPVHRRRWGSVYDALSAGRLDAAALRDLIAGYLMDDGQPISAIDTRVWPRDDAETSPGRAQYCSSSRQSAGQPIVTGWSYSWLAQLSLTHASWTAPLDVQRVPAGGDAHAVAAAQIAELVAHRPAEVPVPLCVFDAGYDPVTLARERAELDGEQVAVLVRLRSGRCFYADPPPAAPGPKGGRPAPARPEVRLRRRGHLVDTHPSAPRAAGAVRAGARARLGRRACQDPNRPQRGSDRPKGIVRGTLVLVEVERLPRQTRIPKHLWLWWRGPGHPDLARLWRAYVRRFDLEHTDRFCKQTLNRTRPRVRTPQQADRWTWLVGGTSLHPAPPGPAHHSGRAPAMGGGPTPRAPCADRRPRPAGISTALGDTRDPSKRAKTLRSLARTTERRPLRPGAAVPGAQKGRLISSPP
jgi:hypothetical protein